MDFMDFVKRELEMFTDQAKKVIGMTLVCTPLN